LGLFLVLYFGCDTKSNEQKLVEKSRVLNFEKVSPQTILKSGKASLIEEDKQFAEVLELQLSRESDPIVKLDLLERLASFWFSKEKAGVSGIYAQRIAEENDNEESWGICGTTFTLCVQKAEDADEKEFCFNRAIKAFDQAISLNPENIDHKINQALCYVEKPLEDNPMKGIMMLLELNRENPENIPVLLQLGKLGLQTNQMEKATERFKKVLNLEPENKEAHCYLAKIYSQVGNKIEAEKHLYKCNQ